MQEETRIQELLDYHILDTPPEEELTEIAQIASAVCNTPMSLVTFIDSHRQWYKAKIGVGMNWVRRTDSFCQLTLEKPYDLLIVADPTRDERFKNNLHVVGAPYIRFYASAPLTSPKGNVLGTLCVMDSKRHEITEDQKIALQLLAKKTMAYLNMRKKMIDQEQRIEHNAEKLKKLTDLVPGVIFQLEARSPEEIKINFVSSGIQNIHPGLSNEQLMKNPNQFFEFIHDDDRQRFRESISLSLGNKCNWSEQFRVREPNGVIQWYWGVARIERTTESTVMYGSLQNISAIKEHEETLHQILHDVSHVIRRPVTSMLGLVSLMEKEAPESNQLRTYMEHVKKAFAELDMFTRQLNEGYTERMNSLRR